VSLFAAPSFFLGRATLDPSTRRSQLLRERSGEHAGAARTGRRLEAWRISFSAPTSRSGQTSCWPATMPASAASW